MGVIVKVGVADAVGVKVCVGVNVKVGVAEAVAVFVTVGVDVTNKFTPAPISPAYTT